MIFNAVAHEKQDQRFERVEMYQRPPEDHTFLSPFDHKYSQPGSSFAESAEFIRDMTKHAWKTLTRGK